MRSVDEALQWLQGQVNNPSQSWKRLCLSLAANAYGYSSSGVSQYGSPNPTTWVNSGKIRDLTKQGTPPKGALVYWKQPGDVGHIAISDGTGHVYTNLSNGRVGRVSISDITNGWGMQYQGWSPPAFPAGGYRVAPQYEAGATSTTTGQQIDFNPNGSGPVWLARFLAAHGLSGDALKTAWAIAMRESGGNPRIDNGPNGTGNGSYTNPNHTIDYGLFQINSVHADTLKQKYGWTLEDMRDPEKAFKYFMDLSKNGTDFGAWNMGPHAYDPANSAQHTAAFQSWLNKFDAVAKKAGVDASRTYGTTSTYSGDTNAQTDTVDPQELAADYGFSVDVITSNSELNGIFQQAVAEEWSPNRFQAALKSTKWYREHSAYWRDAWMQERTGGKDWEVRLKNAKLAIRQRALALGAAPNEDEIDKWARKYIYQGWDKDGRQLKLDKALAETIGRDGGAPGGEAANHIEYLRRVADANGLTPSDNTFIEAARRIAAGVSTQELEEAELRKMAASQYPVYRDKILAGQNAEDLLSPYSSVVKDLLEIPEVKLNDPLLNQVIGNSDKQGNPVAMSLFDFRKKVRQDDRWQYTDNASQAVGDLATNIARTMGFF